MFKKNCKGFYFFTVILLLMLLSSAPLFTQSSELIPIRDKAEDRGVEFDFPRPLRKNQSEIPAGLAKGEEISLPQQIHGFDKPLTKEYIERYSSKSGKEWLEGVMRNAEPYLAFIRREIEERNLPPELLYVPAIESGFVNRAKSKSGAVGMWQFMKNSMSPFDMKITDWMDERMDFWKSTKGALEKLQGNYKSLGDWPLALAAYNMGLNGVNKVIKQGGSKSYWELSEKKLFKVETIHYMPKLLAVSHILSNPRKFGMTPCWADDPEWTRVKTSKTIDLGILAKAAEVDAAVLKSANQELLFTVTPPDKNYYLKVPAAYLDKISAVLERTNITLINYYFYTVKSGDTLSELAHHYGVTMEQIRQSNPSLKASALQIGSRLVIPAYKEVPPYQKSAVKPSTAAFTNTHIVAKGETLWSIALRYKVDPELLADANNMNFNDTLREGRTLKVPIN